MSNWNTHVTTNASLLVNVMLLDNRFALLNYIRIFSSMIDGNSNTIALICAHAAYENSKMYEVIIVNHSPDSHLSLSLSWNNRCIVHVRVLHYYHVNDLRAFSFRIHFVSGIHDSNHISNSSHWIPLIASIKYMYMYICRIWDWAFRNAVIFQWLLTIVVICMR